MRNFKLRQLHFVSGFIISVFVFFHLVNHFCSLFGISTYFLVMDMFRLVYRNIFIETLLLFSVLVQIVSGIKLFTLQIKNASSLFNKLHLWSGLYLAFFLVVHVSAVMVGRRILNLDTNFYFGVAGINTYPINLFFIPYYILAIMSFFAHMAAIHTIKMQKDILGLSPKGQSLLIIFFGFFITLLILLGLTNYFEGVRIPAEFNLINEK